MHSRYLLVTSAALAAATAASAADPAKPEPRETAQPAQPAERPAEVMLAQAEVRTPALARSDTKAATPAKRPRAARVTSCRCGGQNEP